jgi:hypothetical protein
VALVADVLDSVEGVKNFRVVSCPSSLCVPGSDSRPVANTRHSLTTAGGWQHRGPSRLAHVE